MASFYPRLQGHLIPMKLQIWLWLIYYLSHIFVARYCRVQTGASRCCTFRKLQDFRQDAGPVTSSGLEREGSQKGLRCIGTDVHSRGDLLCCVSLHQKSQGFRFPVCQALYLSDQFQSELRPVVPLEQNGQARPGTANHERFYGEHPELIVPFAGCNFVRES